MNSKEKTIREYIKDHPEEFPKDQQLIKELSEYSKVTEDDINKFLDDLIESKEYPDDMEIFTSDRGWHKVKDRR